MAERRSFSQPPRQPRPIVRVTLLIVLAVGLLYIMQVLLHSPAIQAPASPPLSPVTTNTDANNAESPITSAVAMIDEPLAAEPAGLPAWPGEGATRGFGFRRPLDDAVDEVVTWQLPADADAASVVTFYDAAAALLKFERVTPADAANPSSPGSVIYRRDTEAGTQTLTLRLYDSPDGLRFTLWFHYPMSTQADAEMSFNASHGNHE